MSDSNFLQWIHDRLKRVCKESQNVDHLIRLRKIIQKTKQQEKIMKTKCTCSNTYQDEVYGKGIRIANETGKTNTVRCTSCGTEILTVKANKISKKK